jgi:hypothetical protein
MTQQEEEDVEGPTDIREFLKIAGVTIKEAADFLISLGQALAADPDNFTQLLENLPRWQCDLLEFLGMNSHSESEADEEEITLSLTRDEVDIWDKLVEERKAQAAADAAAKAAARALAKQQDEDFVVDEILD